MTDRGVERVDAVLIYDPQSRAAGDRMKTVDAALAATLACPALYRRAGGVPQGMQRASSAIELGGAEGGIHEARLCSLDRHGAHCGIDRERADVHRQAPASARS